MGKKVQTVNRRDFFKHAALSSGAFMIVAPSVLGGESGAAPSDKLTIIAAGAGGRAEDNLPNLADENIAALCDVDDERAQKMYNRFEKAAKYRDYREMMDKHGDADAVVVSTPDHLHAIIALEAIKRGKHVYCEKPLAHSIYEVRALVKAAREHKVVTQLGNQGHSFNSNFDVCEWVRGGAIGAVKEVRCWYRGVYGNGKPRPQDTPPVPDGFDWDRWIGPASIRPFHKTYIRGSWRSWDEFGTGILGDWTCHLFDPSFFALDLDAPTSVVAQNEGEWDRERFPLQSTLIYEFPARGDRPAVKVTWSFGKDIEVPELEPYKTDKFPGDLGGLLVGDKGIIAHGSHGGGDRRILPKSRDEEYQKPEPTLKRVEGGHYKDWTRACKEGRQAGSHFDYGGPLTEVALLGVIACKFEGEKLEWDSAAMAFKNNEKANEMVHPKFREGWAI